MTDLRGVLPGQRPPVDATVLDEPTSEVPIIRPADLADPEPEPEPEPTNEAAAEPETAPEQYTVAEPTAADAIYVDASAQAPPDAEVVPEPDDEPVTDPAIQLAAPEEAVAEEFVAEEFVAEEPNAGTVTAAESVATTGDVFGLAPEPPMAPPREPGPSAWPPPATAASLLEPAIPEPAMPEQAIPEQAIPAWREPAEAFAPEPMPQHEAIAEAETETEAETEDAAAEPDEVDEVVPAEFGAETQVAADVDVVTGVEGETAATEVETVAEAAAEVEADADNEAEELIVELAVAPVAEPVEAELAAPEPRGPGEVTETPIALWTDEAADRLREQWRNLQVQFFDDPDVAVAGAKNLVTEAVQELADTLLAAQDSLDPYREAERVDTEAMRVAMRRYREFLDRVLAL